MQNALCSIPNVHSPQVPRHFRCLSDLYPYPYPYPYLYPYPYPTPTLPLPLPLCCDSGLIDFYTAR